MPRTARPNFIFIVVDDCGYADLGCTGQTGYATPALDRLAAEGIRFTQAYANASLCTNTRVALMTGRYQYRLPLGLVEPLRNAHRDLPDMGIPADFPTLPALLRDAGYRTALIGKWHLGSSSATALCAVVMTNFSASWGDLPATTRTAATAAGHDLYEGETPVERIGYVTDMLSERACAHVRAARARSEPYFLSLHFTAPHWPWSAPSNEAAARVRELDPKQLLTGGSIRIYAEMMQVLDRGIGEVIDEVRRSGDGANTLVLFTSDNGGERYSKTWPFVGRKFDLLEGGLRAPGKSPGGRTASRRPE